MERIDTLAEFLDQIATPAARAAACAALLQPHTDGLVLLEEATPGGPPSRHAAAYGPGRPIATPEAAVPPGDATAGAVPVNYYEVPRLPGPSPG